MARRQREKVRYYDDPVALGRRLRETREGAGLSQRELSFPGCTAAYISRIEKGERVPSLQLIREFAVRLGVSEQFISHGRDDVVEAGVNFVEARVAVRMGELDVARELANTALDRSRSNAERACASAVFGEIALAAGDLLGAIDALERARLLDPSLEDSDAQFAEQLGRAYARALEYESAIAVFERNRDRAVMNGDVVNEVRFSSLLANAYSEIGSYPSAEVALARAINLSEKIDDPFERAKTLWAQSRLHALQQDPAVAARYAERAMEILEVSDHTFHLGLAHQLLAHIELDRGNGERAVELLAEGEQAIVQSGRRADVASLRLEQARALAQVGRKEEAAATASEATELLHELGALDAGRCYVLLAGIYDSLGDEERALELYELAVARLEKVPSRHAVEAYSKLAELLERRGEKDAALEVLKRAMSVQAQAERPLAEREPG